VRDLFLGVVGVLLGRVVCAVDFVGWYGVR